MGASCALVAADCHQQSEGFMGRRAGDAVTRTALFAAATAPPILLGDPARQHGSVRVATLAGHLQAEFVEAAESGQASAGQARLTGSVRHVEVFWMRRVGTFIFERPRLLSRQRRADHHYTLNWEEPVVVEAGNPPGPASPRPSRWANELSGQPTDRSQCSNPI